MGHVVTECSCNFLRQSAPHLHSACCPDGAKRYVRARSGHWHTQVGQELGWSSPRCIHCTLPLAVAFVPLTPAMVVLLRAWYRLTGFATGKPPRKTVVGAMLEVLEAMPEPTRMEHWEAWNRKAQT